MGRTNIKIGRFYDGSRTVKEVMSEAIACKVKKILSDDIENKHRNTEIESCKKQVTRGHTQNQKPKCSTQVQNIQ